jgi:KDO2-lipid IV(A) lauroyltransferase
VETVRISLLLKGLILLILFYPVRWGIQCLSWEWALKIGAFLASLHALCIRDQLIRQIREGIQTVWEDKISETELEHLVQRNLLTRYKHLIDSFFYQRLDENLIKRIVPQIEGKHYLDETLASKKGAILLLSHFGSFGLLIGGLVLRGYRLHVLFTQTLAAHYRTWQWIEHMIIKAKIYCWNHEKLSFTIWRPGRYLRSLYRRLQAGEILVLYGDGSTGHQFTKVNFLGYPLLLSTGAFRVAGRAQVVLIPAFIIQESDDSHRIILEKPIILKNDDPSTIQQGVNQYASLLAHYVCLYPDHWFTWARLRRTLEKDGPTLALMTREEASN